MPNINGVKIAVSMDFFTSFAKIPKNKQTKTLDFVDKFKANPASPGINYEKINASDPNLRSVRIDDDYRGIVLKPDTGNVYVLLWVDKHDNAYDWAKRKKCSINMLTGNIQVYDVAEKPESELSVSKIDVKRLYSDYSNEQLMSLGVPSETLPMVRDITVVEELDAKINLLPQEAYEALYFLACGYSVDEIIDEMFALDKRIESINADYAKILESENIKRGFIVINDEEDKKDLEEMLSAPLEKWRVFLHPSQRKIVEAYYKGPVRILGGAGTGKTVVAMHRAKWLAKHIYNSQNDRILFTTFTKNLANDIYDNLRKICEPVIMRRIEVVNLNQWVTEFLKSQGYNYRIIYDEELNDIWKNALTVKSSELTLDDGFFREEWNRVIKPQEISNEQDYIKASRVGRGVRLCRKERMAAWLVFAELMNNMDKQRVRDIDTACSEARILLEHKGNILPFKSIIVDEGQDLGDVSYKLLRTIAGEEHANDMFIVGDAQQRIYKKKTILSRCGINIIGRSKILKLNYRTTDEIRKWAYNKLNGMASDDLDGGTADVRGYKSLFHGDNPIIYHTDTMQKELKYILDFIKDTTTQGASQKDICLVVRSNKQIDWYTDFLREQGLRIYKIKRSEPENRELPGIRIATMHRVKGLEFDYVIIAGINDEFMPLQVAINSASDDITRSEAEQSERSLFYVAAARAKKSLLVTGYGKKSRFMI